MLCHTTECLPSLSIYRCHQFWRFNFLITVLQKISFSPDVDLTLYAPEPHHTFLLAGYRHSCDPDVNSLLDAIPHTITNVVRSQLWHNRVPSISTSPAPVRVLRSGSGCSSSWWQITDARISCAGATAARKPYRCGNHDDSL